MNFEDTSLYENRELSWLSFNQRVLEEAKNLENPILERGKFLSIVSSNLDEFFMVRVASLKEQVVASYDKPDFAGLTPKMQLKAISKRVHKMVEEQSNSYLRSYIPALKKEGIEILDIRELDDEQKKYVKKYFEEVVYQVLTPLAVDSSRPFPLILNKSLNVAVLLTKDGKKKFATVQVPAVLKRYVEIPSREGVKKTFVLLESIIIKYISRLFIGCKVISAGAYRLTRNGDLSIDEEEAQDLLLEIERSLKRRKWGEAIRLEVSKTIDKKLFEKLNAAIKVEDEDIYYIHGPIDLTFLMKLSFLSGFDELRFDKFSPVVNPKLVDSDELFNEIKKADILLSHPFDSFNPVVDLIKKAANDKKVLAIKQTLYRVSGDSPIIRALAIAADSGKQVTVLVELKARFDEENNIAWARRLEKAGCHVIYGLVGLKTHSKVTLIVRKEAEGINRYVHLATGNYNDSTAKLYTDIGILTTNEIIASDVSAIFNTISGYSEPPKLKLLTMAPTNLREKFYELIRKQVDKAKKGEEALIVAKMNSLCDFGIIKELYKASSAGVKIELIIRGICSLIPGVPGVSENITVRSIVGKYLEHSRIYKFGVGVEEEIYLSSADWMPRNLNRRVELLFPVLSQEIKEKINMLLDLELQDVVKSKIKDNKCGYHRIDRRGKEIINSQEALENIAKGKELVFDTYEQTQMFRPLMSPEEAKLQ